MLVVLTHFALNEVLGGCGCELDLLHQTFVSEGRQCLVVQRALGLLFQVLGDLLSKTRVTIHLSKNVGSYVIVVQFKFLT